MRLAASTRDDAARKLQAWFDDVLSVTDRSLFGVAAAGPHRDAVILNVLTRNARRFRESEVDREGALYDPLLLLLASACRRLDVRLGLGHWRAAVENVSELSLQLADARAASADVGLEIGSPARLLKEQVDEALLRAGVAGPPSFLDPEGQRLALALAVNWGIRFLCAYALEHTGARTDPSRRDLAWIRELLEGGGAAGASPG